MAKQFTLNFEIEDDIAFITYAVEGVDKWQWFGAPSALNEGVSLVIKSVLENEGK